MLKKKSVKRKSTKRPKKLTGTTDLTKSKAAEAQLRQAQAQLRAMGDNLPGVAIFQHIQEPDGRVRYDYISAGIETIFGVSGEKIMANPEVFRRLIHQEDLERCLVEKQKSARDMTPLNCEFRQRTAGGEIKWVHCRSTPRRLENGAILWDGALIDITARKQAEESLRLSEETHRRFFELGAAGMAYIDLQGRLIKINSSFCEITGYTELELLGKSVLELTHPDDQQRARRELELYFARDNNIFSCEKRYIRKDGAVRWVVVSARLVRDHEGRPLYSMGIIKDITERKRDQEALRENEQRLAMAIEGGQMGLWEWNILTQESVWNAQEYRLLGLPLGDGHPHADLFFRHVHPEDAADLERSLKAAIEAGSDWAHEFRIIRADGQTRWLAAVGQFIKSANGPVERMIGINYDITDRKQKEQELRKLNRSLRALSRSAAAWVSNLNWTKAPASGWSSRKPIKKHGWRRTGLETLLGLGEISKFTAANHAGSRAALRN